MLNRALEVTGCLNIQIEWKVRTWDLQLMAHPQNLNNALSSGFENLIFNEVGGNHMVSMLVTCLLYR